MIIKLISYAYTGSAAMLSEAIHSLVDALNQVKIISLVLLIMLLFIVFISFWYYAIN